MWKRWKKKFIGDRGFYKKILLLALPMIVQNAITSFVSFLDNIMVGQLGTEQMSGVAIVNQLINVYNICIFGAVSAASIFGAQFYGKGDHEGVRYAFRFKLICCLLLTALAVAILYFGQSPLISAFLTDTGNGDLEATLAYGKEYLVIILIGLVPYCFSQIYASTLRENSQTLIPMIASTLAVFINLILNALLIFGLAGFPKMGVAGAAIATVISRFVEVAVIIIWTHANSKKYPFINHAYASLHIPSGLVKQIILKGIPLLINESLWSIGQAVMVQCYSTRGLDAVAALNISTTVSTLFNVVFIALGGSISIVVGQLLGQGKPDEAVETDTKIIFFSVVACIVVGGILFVMAPLFPQIYNTTDEIRHLAANLLKVSAAFMPLYAFYHASYFTLRSGGKTIITFLFDSCYLWVVNIPTALMLSRFTLLPILTIFIIVQSAEIFKAVLGYILLKKRVWVNNIVVDFK